MARHVNIYHYRGDTYDIDISISNYTPAETDTIQFGIRKTYDDTDYLVIKTIDPTTMHLHLSTADTQNLPVSAVYDIQLIFSDEEGVSYTQTIMYGDFKCVKDVVRND